MAGEVRTVEIAKGESRLQPRRFAECWGRRNGPCLERHRRHCRCLPIGAVVQRRLNEGRIRGTDGIVERLLPVSLAGLGIDSGFKLRSGYFAERVAVGGIVRWGAAAHVASVGVGAIDN